MVNDVTHIGPYAPKLDRRWNPQGAYAFISPYGDVDRFKLVASSSPHTIKTYGRDTLKQAYIRLMALRLQGHEVLPEDLAWLRHHMQREEARDAHTT